MPLFHRGFDCCTMSVGRSWMGPLDQSLFATSTLSAFCGGQVWTDKWTKLANPTLRVRSVVCSRRAGGEVCESSLGHDSFDVELASWAHDGIGFRRAIVAGQVLPLGKRWQKKGRVALSVQYCSIRTSDVINVGVFCRVASSRGWGFDQLRSWKGCPASF